MILPKLHHLTDNHIDLYSAGADQFRKIAWQLDKLNTYIQCVEEFHMVLSDYKNKLCSEGLLRLSHYIDELMTRDTFRSLKEEMPRFRNKLRNMSFVTVGIQLDHTLRPTKAIFLSAEPTPYKKPSILSNFLGLKSSEEHFDGISQFQKIIRKPAFENALFRELEEVFKESVLPIGASIRKYTRMNIVAISDLALEICFYIGASKWIEELRGKGLSMCKPIAIPKDNRTCEIKGLRDAILAMDRSMSSREGHGLNSSIVGNDVEFGPKGRVFILTGPNQGGKTTYTRSIGLAQVLFQAGLYIPGTSAKISPVDWIYTHFNEEETPDVENGRLGEELQRISVIFDKATKYSLVLLNESFSSTSPSEGLYLAQGVIKGIVIMGCRTVFATHFHELATNVDNINTEFSAMDNKLISMVAGIEKNGERKQEKINVKRTYKVVPSPPQGLSYAQDIACFYGVSFEQIKEKLNLRRMESIS